MDSWGVRDFKSISSANIRLDRGISLIAGQNSSGKSSIFQSLLVLAQSVQAAGGVVLNGPLVRLGAGRDVVRLGQETCTFGGAGAVRGGDQAERGPVRFETTLGIDPLTGDLVPVAFNVWQSDGELILEATTSRLNGADARLIRDLAASESMTVLRLTKGPESLMRARTYLLMEGLVPFGLASHVAEREVKAAYTGLNKARSGTVEYDRVATLWMIERDLRHFRILKSGEHQADDKWWTRRDLRGLDVAVLSDLLTDLAAHRIKESGMVVVTSDSVDREMGRFGAPLVGVLEDWFAETYSQSMALVGGIAEMLRRFANGINYLGPLRDEPRVLHSAWDLRARSLPVGARGELTAEVLTRSREQSRQYVDPRGNQMIGTLAEAVGVWCRHLGIGTEVKVIDQAKLGRGVELVVDGTSRDLTAIGVGASQLLPVVVSVLMPHNRGEFLLVEQPELHLHPAVQARLADFFLLAGRGLRILVETHSEALINRVRLRVAEAESSPDAVQIIFVEQTQGSSTARSLELDKFGDLDYWPKGFIDDRLEESQRLAAAVTRRLHDDGNAS